jgi:hypothetical protein
LGLKFDPAGAVQSIKQTPKIMSDLALRRSLLLSPVWRDQEREIAKLKGQLKKAKANANCLRKYKFQTIKMKSQIRALINQKEQAPPKIANLFQFLRDNDYDAYLHLENMLLPISYRNRMETCHKYIRVPSWWGERESFTAWVKSVRKPGPNYEYTHLCESKWDNINVHGVIMRSERLYYDSTYKLQMNEQKDELIKQLKVVGIEAKMSWSKAKMYEKLMELE